MKKLRISVLGGSGFVGRNLCARLAHDGHDVRVFSRNPNAHLNRQIAPGITVDTLDVYDEAKLSAAIKGSDAVINLVGILNERGDNGKGFHHAHVQLTRVLVSACKHAGVSRLIHMSALNAGRGKSNYLRSKGEAEDVVKISGLDWTIFQPSVIFGPGDGLFGRFSVLLQLAPILPLARPDAKFAPVFIGDVVEAFVRCLKDSSSFGRTYELYGPDVFRLIDLVRMTARQINSRCKVVGLPDPLGRLQAMVFDWIPGKPFSSDNYRSLLTDSVGAVDGLHQLAIKPTTVRLMLPEILGSPDQKQSRLNSYRAYR